MKLIVRIMYKVLEYVAIRMREGTKVYGNDGKTVRTRKR
jgi:hypothetical protein